MTGQLLDFIMSFKAKADQLKKYDEIETKQAMILPILQFLGWNVWDTDEVKPEHPVEGKKAADGGRVDFCLRIKKKSEIFLEIKRPSEELEKHQEQLLDYSFREGIDIAVLSNGMVWWFYLARKKGHWKERKFYAIDISQQRSDEIGEKFNQLLSKQNVQSGDALQSTEFISNEKDKKKKITETLPKAWNKVVGGYDSILLDLLADTTESMCGFRPEIEDIKDVINNSKGTLLLSETSTCRPKPSEKFSMLKNKKEINKQYQAQQFPHKIDVIMKFIEEKCLLGNEFIITAGKLYKAYSDWANDNGLQKIQQLSISKRTLGLMLAEQGFQKSKGTAGVRLWLGIALR
jgi:hypothetical protein